MTEKRYLNENALRMHVSRLIIAKAQFAVHFDHNTNEWVLAYKE